MSTRAMLTSTDTRKTLLCTHKEMLNFEKVNKVLAKYKLEHSRILFFFFMTTTGLPQGLSDSSIISTSSKRICQVLF